MAGRLALSNRGVRVYVMQVARRHPWSESDVVMDLNPLTYVCVSGMEHGRKAAALVTN